jgi:hypothetical protein
MTTSYLIVNQWKGDKLEEPNKVSLFRRVNASGAKARKLGVQYAIKLNSGKDFLTNKQAQLEAIQNNAVWYSVVAEPDYQAREHRDYLTFMECELFGG